MGTKENTLDPAGEDMRDCGGSPRCFALLIQGLTSSVVVQLEKHKFN